MTITPTEVLSADEAAKAEAHRARTEFLKHLKVHPNLKRRQLNPDLLINPMDAQATRQGPLKLRWYRDEAYRIWEESKDLTARWSMSQKLAPKAQAWMQSRGITAFCEIPAVWRSEEGAKRNFETFIKK